MLRRFMLPAMVVLGSCAFSAAQEPVSDLKRIADAQVEIQRELRAVTSNLNTLILSVEANKLKAATDVAALQAKVEVMQREIESLRGQLSTSNFGSPSTSAKVSESPAAPILRTGLLEVINEDFFPVEVRLNGQSFVVNPGSRLFNVPSGTYRYQVVGRNALPVTATIRANESRVLRIFP